VSYVRNEPRDLSVWMGEGGQRGGEAEGDGDGDDVSQAVPVNSDLFGVL
jgi:hypothetical protein